MREEIGLLAAYAKEKNLKMTRQRDVILKTFLAAKRHFTVDELYLVIREKNPSIGRATIFRTLKLFCECGLATEFAAGDKMVRYEIKYGHSHHDHLICTECGTFIEVVDDRIEKLQDDLCRKYAFGSIRHRLDIFGICRACRKK